jgi:hypothetical protein
VSIANVTPPSASRISVQFIGANDVCQIGPSNVTNANQLVRMTSTGIALALVSTMTVEGTTMAYYGSDSACSVKAVGWEDNL